jgi:hypothetical protein
VLRSLARACTRIAGWTIALGVSSCSLVLDWSGYTGGDVRSGDGDGAVDAAAVPHVKDAPDEREAAEELDSANDGETSDVGVLDVPPPCSPKHCGGCCTADGFCAGGASAVTCGTGGKACVDCASMGQGCNQGVCSSVVDGGAVPMCSTDAQCRSMLTLLCIPAYQVSCCLQDGTCGCQVEIPKLGTCM